MRGHKFPHRYSTVVNFTCVVLEQQTLTHKFRIPRLGSKTSVIADFPSV